jgi:tetratricopeptide (TPR) repeat protein
MELDSIAGYEILETLGKGGMGTVFLARDETLDRTLAVKVIRPENLGSSGKERFLREARACSLINHPNIVTVYAAGEDEGLLYLAMELLEGRTVREIIEEGPVDWRTAVSWMIDLLGALAQLHGEGLVHRDLKPENIIVTSSGVPKLMDFGIVRVITSQTITVEGSTVGTVTYMSPEQALGKRVDASSDVFSMGIVLYELLTGQHPFPGDHPMAVMYSITNEPARPIEPKLLGSLPDGLEHILSRALSKEPAERYADASELKNALEGLLEGQMTTALSADAKRRSLLATIVLPAAAVITIATVASIIITREKSSGDRALAEHHNALARRHEHLEKCDLAREEYRNAIIADPGWEVPWNNLGRLALEDSDFEEADSLLNRAIAIDPKYAEAHFNLGSLRMYRTDFASAWDHFEAAIAADSSFIAAYNNLGAMLLDRNRPAEALGILTVGIGKCKANETDSTFSERGFVLKNMGRAHRLLGNDTEAINHLEEAGAILPGNLEIHHLLALLYEKAGRKEESLEHWLLLSRTESWPGRQEALDAIERLDSSR